MITRYLLPGTAVVLLVLACAHVMRAQKPEAPLPPPAQPARTPFSHTVAGTGVVEPQTENISVGTQLPGIVVDVPVRVNEQVRAGAPLFRLDDRELQAKLRLKQAELAQAKSSLTRLQNWPRPEDKASAKAKVAEVEAAATDKLELFRRAQTLRASNSVSAEELTSREQAYLMARAQLAQATTQLEMLEAGTWKYDVLVAEQGVAQAQAQIDQVTTDLERLTVRALVDGQVLQLNVRKGEYVGVSPGQAYVVLGNVDKLHVRVSIDEHDIPRYRQGSPAKAMLKGNSATQYPLRFVRVEPFVVPKKSLTGENTERVDTRVLQLIYAVEPTKDAPPLYVGQQLDVFIDAASGI